MMTWWWLISCVRKRFSTRSHHETVACVAANVDGPQLVVCNCNEVHARFTRPSLVPSWRCRTAICHSEYHAKSISALRRVRYESISDLPSIQKSYRDSEKTLVVIPPVMRICAPSLKSPGVDSGSARTVTEIWTVTAYATVLWTSGLATWWLLKLPLAERRQRDSLNAQSKCGKTGCFMFLKKNLQHLVKSCLQWNRYQPSARNRVRIQQRGTQAERSLDEEC